MLKDGTVKVYTYARYKPPAGEGRAPDSITALIRAFERSPEWARFADSTKTMYSIYLRDVGRLGALRVTDISRRDLLEIRDAIAATRGAGAATGFTRAASALFGWAVDREWIAHSPTERIKTLPGGHLPAWTMHDVQMAAAAVPERLRRAIVLALYTGQRRGDLIRLTWSDYDSVTIRLRQQKTGTPLVLPVHRDLRKELDAWKSEPRSSVTILTDQDGNAWDGMQLSAQMAYHLGRIEGFPSHMNIHGLRKLAATRLADAGCSTHEIAAITGHRTLSMVALYTQSADQERLANAAVVRLYKNPTKLQMVGKTSKKSEA